MAARNFSSSQEEWHLPYGGCRGGEFIVIVVDATCSGLFTPSET